VAIRLRQRDDWTEPGNLWALIVGRPGAMKSPAMRSALAPLERLERRAAEAHNDAMAQHRAEALAAKLKAEAQAAEAKKVLKKDRGASVADLLRDADDVPAPTRVRYIVNGPTWEKLHALLSENPGGLLMERDEMRGWFLDMAREEKAEARSFFVKAWSGGAFTVDRIGRGTVTAADMRVSIIGAIQPGPLSQVMRSARTAGGDDGMIERFLIAWPDDPGPWRDVDRLPDSAARLRVFEVFDHLDLLTPETLHAEHDTGPDGMQYGMPYLRLDDAAHDVVREWRTELEQRIRAPGGDDCEAALTKFRHHVGALALALHLADRHTGRVGATAMLGALALADYFESHARRLYSSGRRATVRAAHAILDKLRGGALAEPFSARDVYRHEWSALSDRETVTDALDMLAAYGWLAECTVDTGGRPLTLYSLNEGARRG
jgi:putative DNA primase/helicase